MSHITLRTSPTDPFDDLKEALDTTRTDALRIAARALLRSPELLDRVRAEVEVAAFIDRLVATYPARAQLRFTVGHGEPQPRIMWLPSNPDGIPLDPDEVDFRIREEGDKTFIDLVDPRTGFGLRSAWWTETTDVDVLVPLKALNVPRPLTGAEPATVKLPDGRTAVEAEASDGTIRRYFLDDRGQAHLLSPDQRAERFFEPAVLG
jgi:hypothetical protein